jgi:hypothetical protein
LTPDDDRIVEKYRQYAIFSLIAKPSTILYLNTDGLAARHCLGHHFFEWHGHVEYARSRWWDKLIDGSFLYEFEFPRISGWTPPGPEPREVLSRPQSLRAELLFARAKTIVIIGYSFGIFKESFDDSVTFEYFCKLLKRYPKKVLIVDPSDWNSSFISNQIRQATDRNNIHTLPVRWDCLAESLVQFEAKLTIKEILYKHDKLADGYKRITSTEEHGV